jgi:lysophospholipase L1-like esterase
MKTQKINLIGIAAIALILSGCGKASTNLDLCQAANNQNTNIHFFGDSITYGGGNNDANGNPYGYAQMLSQDLQTGINDVAVAGSRIEQCGELPNIMATQINAGQIYIFTTGTNDSHQGGEAYLPEFTAAYQQAFNHLTSVTGAKVYLAGPYYLVQDYGNAQKMAVIDDYNTAIQSVAGSLYIDLRSVVNTETMLSSDGVHPNFAGHQAIMNAFLAAM